MNTIMCLKRSAIQMGELKAELGYDKLIEAIESSDLRVLKKLVWRYSRDLETCSWMRHQERQAHGQYRSSAATCS